jgi:hypothetical protein
MGAILIRTFHNSIPAQITAAKLEEAGIQTYIMGEGAVSMMAFSNSLQGGIQLLVDEKDEDSAKQLLFEFDEAYRKASVCKKCGGNEFVFIQTEHVSDTFMLVISRILTGKSQQEGNYYECVKCHNKTSELPEPPEDFYNRDLL